MNISKAILSLGQYEFVINGEIKSEQDWNNNIKFVSGADKNGIAIFSDTKPITYQQALDKMIELEQQEQQAIIDVENNKASAKQKLQDLGLTVEEIKDTFGL